jgi:hypothetical protein
VRTFLIWGGNEFGEPRPEDRDAMPLGLGRPFVFGIFLGALLGDRKHGELATVAFRLTLLRIGASESDDCY